MTETKTTLRDDLLALCDMAYDSLSGYHHERCCGGDPAECIDSGSEWRDEAATIERIRARIEAMPDEGTSHDPA